MQIFFQIETKLEINQSNSLLLSDFFIF